MALNFRITKREWQLALVFAIAGFIFSSRAWLFYLDSLTPFLGLIVYYTVLFVFLFGVSRLGLIVWNIKIQKPLQLLGTILIIFSFFVIVDWTSPYVNIVTKGSVPDNMSVIFFQDEDGAAWSLWTNVVPQTTENLPLLRFLTFAVTPATLSLIGMLLLERRLQASELI